MQNIEAIRSRGLLIAVLERAIWDAIGLDQYFQRSGSVRIEAKEWILLWEEDEQHEPFSFPWVCEHLDLDPSLLRYKLKGFIKSPDARGQTKLKCGRLCETLFRDTGSQTNNEIYW